MLGSVPFLKTATSPSLHGLTSYRDRTSPITLVKYSKGLLNIFCGYVFFGLVCVNFQSDGFAGSFFPEFIISCSFDVCLSSSVLLSVASRLIEYARPKSGNAVSKAPHGRSEHCRHTLVFFQRQGSGHQAALVSVCWTTGL